MSTSKFSKQQITFMFWQAEERTCVRYAEPQNITHWRVCQSNTENFGQQRRGLNGSMNR